MSGNTGLAARTTMVHLRCGDDLQGALREAGLTGPYLRWADPLCQGPTPAGVTPEHWRGVRARHAAEHYGVTLQEAEEFLDEQDAHLQATLNAVRDDEIILWFEHDLFDQIILIYLLSTVFRSRLGTRQLCLVSSGQHLAHLSHAALVTLWEARKPINLAQCLLAQRTWNAFCAPDPQSLQDLLREDLSPLPYLRNALIRHLAEYPALGDGLGLTERLTLEAISRGAAGLREIFHAVQARERAAWLGDTMFWPYLQRLAAGDDPLLQTDHGAWSVTPRGRRVLNQEDDWTRTPGPDRWLGGVYLRAGQSAWRWDDEQQQLCHLT